MNENTKLVAIILLLIGTFFGDQIIGVVKNNIPEVSTPDVLISEPQIEYKNVVQPLQQQITKENVTPYDKVQIRDFFLELSKVVQYDNNLIKTTGQFRKFNITSGGLNFAGLRLQNKYPQLGETVDKVIVNALGQENVPLTQEKRETLWRTLHAIAWAFNQ